jgi:hypothetical protein
MSFVSVSAAFSATDRHAAQRTNPLLTSCHPPVFLPRWLIFDGSACEGRAVLGVEKLVLGDFSD